MSSNHTRKLQNTLVQLRKIIPKTYVLHNNTKQWEKIIHTLENMPIDYEFPKEIVENIIKSEDILNVKISLNDNSMFHDYEQVCIKYFYSILTLSR